MPLLPPPSASASPMPIAASTTTAPTIASTFGFAWRALRGPPFDCTGGGAAAARRICLLFLPLGIGRKGSDVVVAAGSCKG